MRDNYYSGSRYSLTNNEKGRKSTYSSSVSFTEEDEDDSGEVWESGLEVIKDGGEIIVPDKVRKLCTSIQREIPGTEFGLLFKGQWEDGKFKVNAEEYVIPEQNVSAAHIKFDEDLKKYRDRGFTVHIHSHPNSGQRSGFGGTDDEHVNSQFECALLYAGGCEQVVDGIVNIEVENGTYIQIDPDVKMHREENFPDVDMSNIEERKRKKTYKTSKDSDAKQSKFQVDKGFEITEDEEPEGDPMLYRSCPVDAEDLEWSNELGHYIHPEKDGDDTAIFHYGGYLFNKGGDVVGTVD